MTLNPDLREQAVLDAVRAESLERRLAVFRLPWEDDEPRDWHWPLAELRRLRQVVEQQSQEISRLQAELRQAQEAMRLVELSELIDALLSALQRGSARLEGLQVTEASAELKVVLDVQQGRPGLVVGPAGPVDARHLSTLRFELRQSLPGTTMPEMG